VFVALHTTEERAVLRAAGIADGASKEAASSAAVLAVRDASACLNTRTPPVTWRLGARCSAAWRFVWVASRSAACVTLVAAAFLAHRRVAAVEQLAAFWLAAGFAEVNAIDGAALLAGARGVGNSIDAARDGIHAWQAARGVVLVHDLISLDRAVTALNAIVDAEILVI